MSRFELYYWPNLQGRGEFVRLALEAATADFHDVARERGIEAMMRRMAEGPTPSFAPPFLVHGEVCVGQVAAILFYLAPLLGLAPQDEAARLWCHQVQLTITDLVAEVHDTHHPIGSGLYYEDQQPEAERRARIFLSERLPKYLGWLELAAQRNPGRGPHVVGSVRTTADLSVFQVMEGLRYAFPNARAARAGHTPRLDAVHAAISADPAVAAYLASDRRVAFNQDGIFRHYPALDSSA